MKARLPTCKPHQETSGAWREFRKLNDENKPSTGRTDSTCIADQPANWQTGQPANRSYMIIGSADDHIRPLSLAIEK